MKTSVKMLRKLGTFDVTQRTKDGHFDANALLNQWNDVSGNSKREMKRYLESPKTIEFINEISNDLNPNTLIAETRLGNNQVLKVINETTNTPSRKTEYGDNQAVKVIKGRNTKNGRTLDQVWVHPYLFIDFAMYLNPKFKLTVIKYVYDELIGTRLDSGDSYIKLSSVGSTLVGYNYRHIGTAIKWIVYNKDDKGIRQQSTPEQMKEVIEIQNKLIYLIEDGFITDYQSLIKLLRDMYSKKYRKF